MKARSLDRLGDDLPTPRSARWHGLLLAPLLLAGIVLLERGPQTPLPGLSVVTQTAEVEAATRVPLSYFLRLSGEGESDPTPDCEALFEGDEDALRDRAEQVGGLQLRVVEVTGDGIYVPGVEARELVVPLSGWLPPDDAVRGQLIRPLYDRLEAWRGAARALDEQCDRDQDLPVLLAIDRNAPWPLMLSVLYTVGQSGFDEFHFLVQPARTLPAVALAEAQLAAEGARKVRVEVMENSVRMQATDGSALAGEVHGLPGMTEDILADGHLTCALIQPRAAVTAQVLQAMSQLRLAGSVDTVLTGGGLGAAPRDPSPEHPQTVDWGGSVTTLRSDLPRIGPPVHPGTQRTECDRDVVFTEPSTDAWTPIVLGRLTREQLAAVLEPSGWESCAVEGVTGAAMIRLVVGVDGLVTAAHVKESTYDEPDMDACLAELVAGLTFPAPKSGIVVASWPFRF